MGGMNRGRYTNENQNKREMTPEEWTTSIPLQKKWGIPKTSIPQRNGGNERMENEGEEKEDMSPVNAAELEAFLSQFYLIRTPYGYILVRNYPKPRAKSDSQKLQKSRPSSRGKHMM